MNFVEFEGRKELVYINPEYVVGVTSTWFEDVCYTEIRTVNGSYRVKENRYDVMKMLQGGE